MFLKTYLTNLDSLLMKQINGKWPFDDLFGKSLI